MKIAVITSDKVAGSVFHRIVMPHMALAKVYDDVHVTYVTGMANMSDEQIGEFDFAVAHESYWDVGTIERVRKLGVKFIYDIDDYWELEPFMLSFPQWKHINMKHLVLNTASNCDLVTCTTPILRSSLVANIKNRVEIMPNGVDPDDEWWKPSPNPTWDDFRVGYVGALEHLHDIRQIFGVQNNFDIYILSTLHDMLPKGFKRFDGKRFMQYATLYDEFNVVIAPLIVSRFNRHKSELKMIEAGFKKKPIVVSNVEPFTLLISVKNCLTVDKPRPWNWIKQLQRLKDSPALREDLAESLYEDVHIQYDLKNQAVRRRQIYESL